MAGLRVIHKGEEGINVNCNSNVGSRVAVEELDLYVAEQLIDIISSYKVDFRITSFLTHQ